MYVDVQWRNVPVFSFYYILQILTFQTIRYLLE